MVYPQTLENTLRVYDEAILDWVAGLTVDYGTIFGRPLPNHPILRVLASPQKAFASMRNILIQDGLIIGQTPSDTLAEAEAIKVVPLPIITVQRGDYYHDESRMNSPFTFYKFERRGRQYFDHPHPIAIKIPYTVFFWSKKRYTANYFQEWVDVQLGKRGASPSEKFLVINHPLWGNQLHAWKKMNHFDASKMEGVFWDFREMQFYYEFELNAWIFHRVPDAADGAAPALLHNYPAEELNAEVPATQVLDSTAWNTNNLILSLSRIYRLQVIFEIYGAQLSINDVPYDNRYNWLYPHEEGTEPAYKMEFTAANGVVQTKQFILPETEGVISHRFAYNCSTNVIFEILDENESVTQQYILNSSGNWIYTEIFSKQQNNYRLRWRADSGNIIIDKLDVRLREHFRGTTEYVVDSNMSNIGVADWTAIAGAILSKLNIGGDSYLQVTTSSDGDGTEQEVELTSAIYLLTVKILECTGTYRIYIIDPDTHVQDSILVDSNFSEIGLTLSGLDRLIFRVVQEGSAGYINIDNVEIRAFTAPIYQI